MRRSKERLKEIDKVLDDNYADKGAVWCAGRLNENYNYIRSRVQLRGLRMNPQARLEQRSVTSSTMARKRPKDRDIDYKSKYYSAISAKYKLKKELETSKSNNLSLRKELMKLKVQLRKANV